MNMISEKLSHEIDNCIQGLRDEVYDVFNGFPKMVESTQELYKTIETQIAGLQDQIKKDS